MNVATVLSKIFKQYHIVVVLLVCLFLGDIQSSFSAPYPPQNQRGNGYYQQDQNAQLQEMRNALEKLRHEVCNHESETRTFEERLNNIDTTLDSIREEMGVNSKMYKDQLKGNAATLEEKISALEITTKGLVEDLKQFKTHTNDVAAALVRHHQRMGELEKVIEQQNQNIDHLQAAMNALMEILQPKQTSKAGAVSVAADGNSYKVQPGDSLDKIARKYQTTVQALKELNGLSSDKIGVGKVLQIPEK